MLSVAEIGLPVLLALAVIAAVLSPRPGRLLLVQAPILVVSAALAFVLAAGLPGRPRNAIMETDSVAEATVLWSRAGEHGIEMLLEWPGSGGPVLYWWPPSPGDSAQLNAASRDAAARGKELRIRRPFQGPWLNESPDGGNGSGNGGQAASGSPASTPNPYGTRGGLPRFYSPPPPPLPPKGY